MGGRCSAGRRDRPLRRRRRRAAEHPGRPDTGGPLSGECPTGEGGRANWPPGEADHTHDGAGDDIDHHGWAPEITGRHDLAEVVNPTEVQFKGRQAGLGSLAENRLVGRLELPGGPDPAEMWAPAVAEGSWTAGPASRVGPGPGRPR